MKFLIWCACVTICCSGLQLSMFAHDHWKWFWIPVLSFYGLAGVVMGVVSLVKLATGKFGAGLAGRTSLPSKPGTAPHKEE